MPQTKSDESCATESRKRDVPVSNSVTYEIKDDSSPETSPLFNEFLRSGNPSKSGVSQGNGRQTEDNTSISVLSNDCYQDSSRDSNIDLQPSNLLNGHCSKNEIVKAQNQYKRKSTLFTDSLLSSLIREENSIKIINDSVTPVKEDFSDLLSSISFPNHESKDDSKLNFEVSDKHGVNITPDDIMKLGDFKTQRKGFLSDILSSISLDEHDSSLTSDNLSSYSNQCFKGNQSPGLNKFDQTNESNHGTLSDILSSISFDEIETSVQNGFISSSNSSPSLDDIKIPISNELNPDFPTINFYATDNASKLNAPNLEGNDNLSDMLSSIIFHENDTTGQSGLGSPSVSSLDSGQNFEKSDSLLNELSREFLKSDAKVKFQADDKLIATISTPKTSDHDKTSIHEEKIQEFSFFSVSPDNAFSAMVSNLGKTSYSPEKNTDKCLLDISMLDLIKSVNTDSNGSLFDYLNTPSESKETKADEQAVNTVLDELLDIDLSPCIKTSDDSLNILQNEQPLNEICVGGFGGFMKPVFDNIDSNSPKPPRMNLNQSLFAKSLSCKPKKNPVLLRKVALIKSELYKHYFAPNTSDCTDQGMVICNTNDCMIRFKGRRLCPKEVR